MRRCFVWLFTVLGLAGCSANDPAVTPVSPSTAQDEGARLFEGNCVACHQSDARGIPGVYPSLARSPVVLGDPRALALWVMHGVRPPALPAGRYTTSMPKFGWMSAAQTAALITYLRAHFGNDASAVDAQLLVGTIPP